MIIWVLLFLPALAYAQQKDVSLAEEYYSQNEFEKAREVYERVARMPNSLSLIYSHYLKTLVNLKDWKEAEKLAKRQSKENPETMIYRLDYAWVMEQQNQPAVVEKEISAINDELRKRPEATLDAIEHAVRIDHVDWAEKIILASRKNQKEKTLWALEMAQVYALQGKQDLAIEELITFAVKDKDHLDGVKSALQDNLSKPEEFDKLEQNLLTKLEKDQDQIVYNELLLWIYLQQKRFTRAFVQARALDKRYQEEGNQIVNIAQIAQRNNDYNAAAQMYEYVIKTYPAGLNYSYARNMFLKCKEDAIKNTYPIDKAEIENLIKQYKQLLGELGRTPKTKEAIRNMALLYAFYLDKKDTAVVLLNEAIELSQGSADFMSLAKMDLGDIYLLKDEAWESTLLYSQVELARKEHPIGHEAKLRNAKLSYYKGEFDLATEHLDILKEATSREISNDAMELSLLIKDNILEDTLGIALKEFSKVELKLFQHKEREAMISLDTLLKRYPKENVVEKALLTKARLLVRVGKAQDAIKPLEDLQTQFPEGIYGDDAMFLLGKVYEENIQDKDKAKTVYQDFLVKYPASIFTAEARKRFRILRGDFMN
jgi:tetratricopeptide (TPR) repeat protein